MSLPVRSSPQSKPRSRRSDGAQTRGQILQTAGQLFAINGFERTTSKEICVAAGSNMAAVNYHFGDKDGLYDAVLTQAHAQLVQLADLEKIQHSDQSAEDKLYALISLFVQRVNNPALSWGLSVLVHEILAPSNHLPALIQAAVLPKIRVMRSLMAQLLELPDDHPAVQRSLAFVVMPCIMLVIAPNELRQTILPGLDNAPDALTQDMAAYALAGLKSMKQRYVDS